MFDPDDPQTLTAHLNSDPELRKQMLRKEFVYSLGGLYYLTTKGRFEFQRRARARHEAVLRGLVIEPGKEPKV